MKLTEAQKHLLALIHGLDGLKEHLSPIALKMIQEHYMRAFNYLEKIGAMK